MKHKITFVTKTKQIITTNCETEKLFNYSDFDFNRPLYLKSGDDSPEIIMAPGVIETITIDPPPPNTDGAVCK